MGEAGVVTKPGKAMYWGGWAMSLLPCLLLLMGSVMALSRSEQALEGLVEFGYPEGVLVIIGGVELACTILYLIPRTAVLGAILLTGYLGGAVATHVRVEDPLFFPAIIVAILLWGGLYLRDARIRALIPLRSAAS